MSSNGLHRKNVITVFLSSKTISGLFLCVSQLGEDSVASVSAIYELFPKCPFFATATYYREMRRTFGRSSFFSSVRSFIANNVDDIWDFWHFL